MKKIILSLFVVLFTFPGFTQNTGLTVVTPNGGENWIIGCPATIQWITAASITAPVRIELYKNGAFYMMVAQSVPAGTNTFTWIPPYSVIPGSTFKIKVSVLTTSGVPGMYDFSNNNFTISLGTITVVSPNGGEVWQYGTTHLITWTDNLCDNVRIELWKGGTYYSLITPSTPSNGSFPWAITNAIAPGNDYKVKILGLGVNAATANVVYDFSNANFTIGGSGIMVVVPNGGELWYTGGSYNISWIDNVTENCRIELWKAGSFLSVIANSATSPYSWMIPAGTLPGPDYKVKVIALTTATNKFDFSDNNFTISSGCFITITTPNGGETWAKGTTHFITWQSNSTSGVRIELWKTGLYSSLIAVSAPNTGSFAWAIPATLLAGNDYKVRIIALTNSGAITCSDFSDNNFSIVGTNITPQAIPGGGTVTLYPNPVSSSLNVKFEDAPAGPVSAQVISVTGKLVLEETVAAIPGGGTIGMDVSDLANGPYVLVVRNASGVMARKSFVVIR